jgi:dihydrofolate reductase
MSALPSFKAIAAIDSCRGLGIKGDLPWQLPEDLKHFARTTKATSDPDKQNAVVMGRVTCETIPEKYWPLSGRRNAVVTRNPEWRIDGADVFTDLETALRTLEDKVETIYVVGGGQIYSLAIELPACEELILTRIHKNFDCDAFFPEYEDRYHLAEELGTGSHDGLEYTFEKWIRNTHQPAF